MRRASGDIAQQGKSPNLHPARPVPASPRVPVPLPAVALTTDEFVLPRLERSSTVSELSHRSLHARVVATGHPYYIRRGRKSRPRLRTIATRSRFRLGGTRRVRLRMLSARAALKEGCRLALAWPSVLDSLRTSPAFILPPRRTSG